MNDNIPRLVITPGDPAGIGPDLCVLIAQRDIPAELVVIADSNLLKERAEQLGIKTRVEEFVEPGSKRRKHSPGVLSVIHEPLTEKVTAGELNQANARYVLNTLDKAIDGCLEHSFDALVTGPVHKGIINSAGIFIYSVTDC